jgi:hypothetical protein
VQAVEGAPRLEVGVLEEQGSDVRVGVRLEHVRFAVWMTRARFLAIVARDQSVSVQGVFGVPSNGVNSEPIQVVLRPGALVLRLAHDGARTRVRYVGPLETDGWLPDEALTDRAPADRTPTGRVPTGRKPLMLMPGAVIRVEPKWAAAQLAMINQGYVVDEIKQIDDSWSEVSYEDGDLFVHGYVSRHEPPGRIHRGTQPEPSALTPNASVPDGTCLHVGGEPVGFLVGDQQALLERANRPGWFTLTIDTPWGPLAFDARGTSETELQKCAAG